MGIEVARYLQRVGAPFAGTPPDAAPASRGDGA